MNRCPTSRWGPVLIALAVGAAGCGNGGSGDPDGGGGDGGAPCPTLEQAIPSPACDQDSPGDGETRWYVLDRFELQARVGLPLDPHVTAEGDPTGCGKQDIVYDVNGDGETACWERGVDNQLSQPSTSLQIISPDPDPYWTVSSQLLVLEVADVDDPAGDPCVRLRWRHATVAGGTDLDADQDGALDPGLPLVPDTVSYPAGPGFTEAALDAGRVVAGTWDIDFPSFPYEGGLFHVPLRRMWIRFALGPQTLDTVVLGAAYDIDIAIAENPELFAADGGLDPDFVRAQYQDIADLDPDDAGICQRVSVGLPLTFAPAAVP